MTFIETSALDSLNVEQAFEQVIHCIHDQVQRQLLQLERLLDKRLALDQPIPNTHPELLEQVYQGASEEKYGVYNQQQLNRITAGAYMAK